MQEVIFVAPLLMYFMNRIRGSRTEEFLPESWGIHKILPNGAPFAALALALLIGIVSENWIVALATLGVYIAGESFGWAKWVQPVYHWFNPAYQATYNEKFMHMDTGKSSGIHQIANALFKENNNFTWYCITALFLRGIYWFAPLYIVFVAGELVSIPVAIVSVLAIGALFPISHKLVATEQGGWYVDAERWYGACQGVVLAISIGLF